MSTASPFTHLTVRDTDHQINYDYQVRDVKGWPNGKWQFVPHLLTDQKHKEHYDMTFSAPTRCILHWFATWEAIRVGKLFENILLDTVKKLLMHFLIS